MTPNTQYVVYIMSFPKPIAKIPHMNKLIAKIHINPPNIVKSFLVVQAQSVKAIVKAAVMAAAIITVAGSYYVVIQLTNQASHIVNVNNKM